MEITADYRNNDKLRNSLCDLAKQTFGIDLTGWYDAGFWQDDYIPYSIAEDGEIISNVSVNVCNIKWRSRVYHLAQLGTVMTRKDKQQSGYCESIMKRVLADCDRSFEGTFLYTERNMEAFYGKFGFKCIKEYQCRKKVNITQKADLEKIPTTSREDRARIVDIIQNKPQYGDRIMVNNPGLVMFHITGTLSECVYYLPSCEAYAVASAEGGHLMLYAVYSSEKVSLGEVISSFGSNINTVSLMFTPENNTGFDQIIIGSDTDVLMARGGVFDNLGSDRFMLPRIAQA
ncbi:MAG: GNAT family N-acetyltransferase [Lachnospiraceae bacterium]|nr:GNAT family N-acetyltransferase [Lachnospiraceae bacterium]